MARQAREASRRVAASTARTRARRAVRPSVALTAFFALAALLALPGPAAAQVDSSLVGMWKLQWVGPDVWWQVRADGVYRLVGTGASPYQHWGRMQAAGGRWSSEWEQGTDGGSFVLRDGNWVVTGALGTGTWSRVWPSAGAAPQAASCPHLATSIVQDLFASPVTLRTRGETCDFLASRVGGSDELSVTAETVTPLSDGLRLKRADCDNGTNRDPNVRCIAGVGDSALIMSGSLHVYRGDRLFSIRLELDPPNPVLQMLDMIELGRSIAGGAPQAATAAGRGAAPTQTATSAGTTPAAVPPAASVPTAALPDIVDPCRLVTADEAARTVRHSRDARMLRAIVARAAPAVSTRCVSYGPRPAGRP